MPYATQISEKQSRCETLLPQILASTWQAPCVSSELGFRNRAKLVIGGSAGDVTVGILDASGVGVDLRACVIQSPGIREVLPRIVDFLNLTQLPPYSVQSRQGELKYVHVTEAPSVTGAAHVDASGVEGQGALMIRVVGRTQRTLDVVRSRLAWLRETVPHASVVTVNLLPEHRAVLEGDREEVLFGATLPMRLDAVTLHLRPQSFFQTNTGVAAELYAQVRAWIAEVKPASLWDLYCGVGGFALHCGAPGRMVTGVEVSSAAVESAQRSAKERGVEASFVAADATQFALSAPPAEVPEALIVNPPRRGMGETLSVWIERSEIPYVVYSSCNPETLAADLAHMPSFQVVHARLFDMFPHTAHLEVAVLLKRV